MPSKIPIWLDCDPGHDDAFAILLAAEHPSFDLLGISTVHGNSSLPNVTQNALSILTAIGRSNVPVYPGAAKPFMRPAIQATGIHGDSGIDGTSLLPAPAAGPQPGNCVQAMYSTLVSTPPGTAVIVATGTLTNVAVLFTAFPDIVEHIRAVSIMGGAFGSRPDACGNIAPAAEFNIYCDPESARAVLCNPRLDGRVMLVPLDLTHTVLANDNVIRRLEGDGLKRMLRELLTFFKGTYERKFQFDAPPLHDPLAVAVFLDEMEWEWETCALDVVCYGEEVGRTRKLREESDEVRKSALGGSGVEKLCNIKVPKALNVETFWEVLLDLVDKVEDRYDW